MVLITNGHQLNACSKIQGRNKVNRQGIAQLIVKAKLFNSLIVANFVLSLFTLLIPKRLVHIKLVLSGSDDITLFHLCFIQNNIVHYQIIHLRS